jgi:hypothetical protein
MRVLLLVIPFMGGCSSSDSSQPIPLGATYYVATTGSDSSPGTKADPFRTIRRGASVLTPGATLYIRVGSYTESIDNNDYTIPPGISWSTPVTIAGYPGETVILKPVGTCTVLNLLNPSLQYVIFRDIVLDGIDLVRSQETCVVISMSPGTHHLRLQNLEVKNSPWHGILAAGRFHEFTNLKVHHNGGWVQVNGISPGVNGAYLTTDDSIIDGGEYYNNMCIGVRFFDSDPSQSSDNNIVRNARLHDNGVGHGLDGTSTCPSGGSGSLLGGVNNVAYNNLIYQNLAGLQVVSANSALGMKVYNNTFYKNGNGINIDAGSVGVALINNIIYQATNTIVDAGTNTTISNNLQDTDPKFANADASDFHILTGSPAIDAGTTLSVIIDDFARVPRPQGLQYDIGAYEYVNS